jgi:glycosyltransferase involved in cell wall biosynthesis
MKMLYLYIGGGLAHSSVQSKLEAKISRFNSSGIETKGLFLSYAVDKRTRVDEYIDLLPLKRVANKYFTAVHQRKANAQAVSYIIEQVQADYDVIYFRYPGASAHLIPILKKYGHKMLFEHNSKELEELKLHGKSIPFGLRPSTFIPWLQDKKWRIAHEARYARPMLNAMHMGLAVTNDMADYEIERSGGSYNCIGNSNGVDVQKVPLRKAPKYDGKELRMIFMRGANTNAPYHGVDRLLHGLKNYTGPLKLTLYLVGAKFDQEKEWLAKNGLSDEVEFTGKLTGDDLSALFDTCHVSFGSLGLHRIKMWEGSVLKVNESLARGIPVVVAHKDMELFYNKEFEPYHLLCPADESAIDLSQVGALAERVYADPAHPEKIRSLALRIVDYSVKIKRAAEIIKKEFGFS